MATNDSQEFDYTPGYVKPTHEYGAGFGDEFHAPAVVELLASTTGYRQRGVTLAGGQGVLPTGCVLARKTATGKYYAYTLGASDGTQTPLGFLRNGRDTTPGGTSTDCQANLVYSGALNLAVLSGTDTASLVAGAAGGIGSATTGVITLLGGRVVSFGSGIGAAPFAGSSMDKSSQATFIF